MEDMDSLFEGMVLFNPQAHIEEADNNQKDQIEADAGNQQDNRRSDDDDDDSLQIGPPVVSSSVSHSRPLDENLFSDLTLVVIDPLEEVAAEATDLHLDLQSQSSCHQQQPSSITTSSSSRRRKRSGLRRVGYGRGGGDATTTTTTVDDRSHSSSSSPLPQPHPQAAPSLAAVTTESYTPTTTITTDDDDVAVSVSSACEPSSAEAEFLKVKATIQEKLNHARQQVNSASAVRKDAIRSRRKAVENATLASLKYIELENQLEQACEAEDFETAENVSQQLSAAEKDKLFFANSLREADAFIDALDLKLQQALDSHIAAEEECAILLDHYATNALNNADSALKKAKSVYSKEMDQWLSSSEALEVKKMELEIESHFISEANFELNNTIEHSIEDDKREKEILCERKAMLMGELEQLLALVKQKEKEIADNDSKLTATEKKINNVVSGFKEIQSSINVKYDKLQCVLAQVKSETETLAPKKDKIDNFLIREEEMGAKLRDFARVSEEEAKGYWERVKLRRSLMSSILKCREDKLALASNEEKLSGDVKLFNQEVSAARTSLQELSSRKSSIQQDMATFKQRILFIDKRVPELEAEKKVATAARNFKEAARIATEAKSLCVEKEGIQIDMDTATSNLEKLEEEIKGTLNRLHETEGMIILKQKELAIARYQKLLWTAATARSEKDAALELGDVEEANLLIAEADAADCEAEKLPSTFNFKAEDITNSQKGFISVDLVSFLDKKQLEELAVSLHLFS